MNSNSESRKAPADLRARLKATAVEAILAAAEEVIAVKGMDGSSMQAIAAHAGTSVGTLYNHFEDRDALLTALMRARREELGARLDEAMGAASNKPFRVQLATLLGALFAFFDAHRAFLRIAIETEHHGLLLRALKSQSAMGTIRGRAERLVKLGVEERALRSQGSELHAAVLFGIARGVMVRGMDLKDHRFVDDVELAVDVFLHGAARK